MKLSVLVITYNHERYIAQALESILSQKTGFDYEIVIGEDCSTDRTRTILLDYQRKYPERIKLLLAEENSGATRNFIRTYEACRGEYVALLEGDDLWTSPDKLQEQVDFLDNHAGFVMCFTNSRIVNENGDIIKEDRLESRAKNLSQSDIISGLVPPTNTVVFRNHVLTEIPEIFYTAANGDMFFFSMLTGYGDAGYIDKNTGNYRIHGGGIWSRKSESYYLVNNLKVRLALLNYFPKHKQVLLPVINSYYSELLMHYSRNRSIRILPLYFRLVLTDLKFLDFGFIYILVHLLRNFPFFK